MLWLIILGQDSITFFKELRFPWKSGIKTSTLQSLFNFLISRTVL